MAREKQSQEDRYFAPFPTMLRELMQSRGVTQEALAKVTGRTRQTVSQYVNGISEPSYDVLVDIADFFDVSTDYLLCSKKSLSEEVLQFFSGEPRARQNLSVLLRLRKIEAVTEKLRKLYLFDSFRPDIPCSGDENSLVMQLFREISRTCGKYEAVADRFSYQFASSPERAGTYYTEGPENFMERLENLLDDFAAADEGRNFPGAVIAELMRLEQASRR